MSLKMMADNKKETGKTKKRGGGKSSRTHIVTEKGVVVVERKNRIPALMKARGFLTIYSLAKQLRSPYSNVRRLVRSDCIPDGTNYVTLVRLATLLGVTLDDLEEWTVTSSEL